MEKLLFSTNGVEIWFSHTLISSTLLYTRAFDQLCRKKLTKAFLRMTDPFGYITKGRDAYVRH